MPVILVSCVTGKNAFKVRRIFQRFYSLFYPGRLSENISRCNKDADIKLDPAMGLIGRQRMPERIFCGGQIFR